MSGLLSIPTTVDAIQYPKYANCAALNKVYPHGVGLRKGLVNKGGKRVAYKVLPGAYNANKAKDRDKDLIACEK